jgi:hypothetical protein
MTLVSKALVLVLSLTAIACFSGPSSSGPLTDSSGSSGPRSATGGIGLHVTLQGGQTLTALTYSLSNGDPADTLAGTIPLSTGDAGPGLVVVPIVEILPVMAATDYMITLSGVSKGSGPVVTCTGSAGPFAVTAGNQTVESVLVTCTATYSGGSVAINGILQNCPTQSNLIATQPIPNNTSLANTSTIYASAVAPNMASLTYTFSVISGNGALSGQTTLPGNVASSILLTCPAFREADTIEVVSSDQTGAVCPASLTTSAVVVVCGFGTPEPCTGVGTGIEASPDTATGTCPPGSVNSGSLTDSAGNFCCASQRACFNGGAPIGAGIVATPDTATGTCPGGLFNFGLLTDSAGNFCCGDIHPCTTAAMAAAPAANSCVTCQYNSSGICSPTEAQFVQLDIINNVAKGPGPDNAEGSCYACLGESSCLDDTVFDDTGNECEDTIGFTSAGTSAQCEAVISCILASSRGGSDCASPGLGGVYGCYCGGDATCTAGSLASPVTSGVNGACDTEIATALGYPLGDGRDVADTFYDGTRAGGRADSIFNCAAASFCNSCFASP